MAQTISESLLKNLLANLNDSLAPQNVTHIDDNNKHMGPFFAVTALTNATVDVSECNTNIKEFNGGNIQDITTDFVIPKGVTIYGNFDSIEITGGGTVLAYSRSGVTITADS